MSVMLGLLFILIGLLALASMVASWRQFGPAIAALRAERRADPQSAELRLTLIEHVLVRLRANRGPLRHRHRPKPIVHRSNGRRPSRSIA
jgi:Tfp pilus assembly protein PilV